MKTKLFAVTWIGMFLLIACAPVQPSAATPNIAFITTSAAQTVMANFTLTAASAAPTSTLTSLGTPTSPATPTLIQTTNIASTLLVPTQIGHPGTPQILLCDEYSWDNSTVDVNIPDNTQMTAGQSFVKTWKIKNSGTCTWTTGYKIIFSSGNPMAGQPQPLPVPVAPGQEIEISVSFIAPAQSGSYSSAWTLQNANGNNFFGSDVQGLYHAKPLYVKIVVK